MSDRMSSLGAAAGLALYLAIPLAMLVGVIVLLALVGDIG